MSPHEIGRAGCVAGSVAVGQIRANDVPRAGDVAADRVEDPGRRGRPLARRRSGGPRALQEQVVGGFDAATDPDRTGRRLTRGIPAAAVSPHQVRGRRVDPMARRVGGFSPRYAGNLAHGDGASPTAVLLADRPSTAAWMPTPLLGARDRGAGLASVWGSTRGCGESGFPPLS